MLGDTSNGRSVSQENIIKKPENHAKNFNRDAMPGSDLWTDGLICAFEFVRGRRKPIGSKAGSKIPSRAVEGEYSKMPMPTNGVTEDLSQRKDVYRLVESASLPELQENKIPLSDVYNYNTIHQPGQLHATERFEGSHWVPIGWDRISQLTRAVQGDAGWASQQFEFIGDDDDLTVADLAAPYWERPAGPIWWCHVSAGHPSIEAWLNQAPWLHPAISLALRDESRLISERMKHLLYEVPVRVAGGLLFELLGQSAGDPFVDEDDIPIVLRSWQAQNFLITVLHIKGSISKINVLGLSEVQELLGAGGYNAPKTVHEVIAYLASRLTRWDDRLFRKSIFGAADEIELKFMNRRNIEDMNL